MRFAAERAQRRGKGQCKQKRERKKERESERERGRARATIRTITCEAFDHHSQKQTEKNNKNIGRQAGWQEGRRGGVSKQFRK